jgi:hypothetical protein
MNKTLKEIGVRRNIKKGCACKKEHMTYGYSLPVKLEPDVVPFLKSIGVPGASFEKTSLLRIETKDVSVVGIRRLKEIKIIFKNKGNSTIMKKFENAIVEYIKMKK